MKILGLDISTKTGYAVMDDGALIDYGLLKVNAVKDEHQEDFAMLERANLVTQKIMDIILTHDPDKIVVEQTNQGSFRGSQKQLEFLHCTFLTEIVARNLKNKVFYVDTSKWRSILKIRLSKDQKTHNKKVKNGAAKGKITPKHLVVIWANQKFGLKMLKKDHDICDAIALAQFGAEHTVPSTDHNYDLDKILTIK